MVLCVIVGIIVNGRKEMKIEITGLTKRQKVLADILWTFDEWDQVQKFVRSLPERDRIDCEGIVELMRLALVEQYAKELKEDGLLEDSNDEANEVINRIRNKR